MPSSHQCWCQTGTTWSYNVDPIGPLRASTGHSVPSNWWAENFNRQRWNGFYLSKTGDHCYQTWYWLSCQNCNRNRTNFWTSLVWCFYEICTICKWHIASYITSYDCCTFVLYFISFAGNTFLYLCLSSISLCWKNESPIVTWFGLEWVPKSSLDEARGLTVPALLQALIFLRVWSVARGRGDSPFSSGFGPIYSWCHTPTCTGTATEAERPTCKLEGLWAGEFVN